MAIKVKSRLSDEFVPFECRCGNCGAVLEVGELKDIKIDRFGGVRDEPGDFMLYVACPDCNGNVLLPQPQQKLYLAKIRAIKNK